MPAKCLPTLNWLNARGYDGNFRNLATLEDDTETGGRMLFTLTEPEAWAFASNVECDGHAFLTCNGDADLSAALRGLLERIV
jgi:hypothetical protein